MRCKPLITIVILTLFSFHSTLNGQVINVAKGSYTTKFPGTDVAGRNGFPTGTPYLIDSLKGKPIPTNDWWSAKVKNDHCSNLFNYPLTMKTINSGLVTSYIPWGVISDIEPIVNGVKGLNAQASLISHYSDWLIGMTWKNNSHEFTATTGMGMPFTYFNKAKNDSAYIMINSGSVTIDDECLLVENAYNGADFVIYAPKGSVWNKKGKSYTSSLNGKNYWSMLMLPKSRSSISNARDSFQQYAYVQPTRTMATFSYDENQSKVTTQFRIDYRINEGSDSIVLNGLLPHHWAHGTDHTKHLIGYSYPTVRGELKMIAANRFKVQQQFKGILPTLPYVDYLSDGFNPTELKKKMEALQYEGLSTWTDSYNEGQVMNRLIQTARIAHEMGLSSVVNNIKSTIKERLEDWLTYESNEVAFLFYYNKDWTSLLGYPAGHGQDNNINDHHFHWGYFIHAASFMEEFEPGWAKDFGEMIDLLVRDAASPNRKDSLFPYLRNFNPYTGHCWANGFASFPQGNDQESTSESMQFNSSLIHWGSITNNKDIRDLGIYLYVTEQAAIEEYWFDTKERNFGPNQNYALVSRVWGNSYDNGTFWTSDIAASYGIELYPIHGGSFYLAHDSTYSKRLWNEMAKNTGILKNEKNDNLWHDVYWKFLSFTDPQKAIDLYDSYPNRNMKFGVSDAHTYHWLHSMNALGKLTPSITSNHPLSAVFTKNNQPIYVAKNYGSDSLKVTFSDGYVMTVGPRELKTSITDNRLAIIGTQFPQVYVNTTVQVTFDTLEWEADSVQWFQNGKHVQTTTSYPFTYSAKDLASGQYSFHAILHEGTKIGMSNILSLLVGEQTPYGNSYHAIPGSFQSAHYNELEGSTGQGVTYVDHNEENLGDFRTKEGMDAAKDPNEGDILTWLEAGEWVQYSVDIAQSGVYSVSIRYSNGNSGGSGKAEWQLNGKNVGDILTFEPTGDWDQFSSKKFEGIPLKKGKRILRLRIYERGMNIGKITFDRTGDLDKALPLAQIGGNKSIPSDSTFVSMDGSNSTAGHLGYLKYQWNQIYGPNKVKISSSTSSSTLITGLVKGVYKIRLTVSDSLNSDFQDALIFVQDGGNMAPNIRIAYPQNNQRFVEGTHVAMGISASDLDGSIKQVAIYLDNKLVSLDSIAPYEYKSNLASGQYQLHATTIDMDGMEAFSDTIDFFVDSITGNWVLQPIAGALAVGPTKGDLSWWSNSAQDVTTRGCLFDDVNSINRNGTFQINMGGQTWLEGWQNSGKEACGDPVSPHDGQSTGSWYIDSTNGQLVIVGKGQFLGLPKATNSGELSTGTAEPESRSYQIELNGDKLMVGINFGGGYWQFAYEREKQRFNAPQVSNDNNWSLYPNPTHSVVHIKGNRPVDRIRVLNMQGALVFEGSTNIIDMSGYPKGLYFVQIRSEGEMVSLKLLNGF